MATTGDRDPNLRLSEFEAALQEINQLVRSLPNEEQAERAIHMEDQLGQLLKLILIPVVVSLGFVLFSGYSAWQAKNAADQNRAFQRCQLAQQAEDRITNQDIHDRLAEKHGIDVTEKTLLPARPSFEELHSLCDRFYSSTSSGP